MQKGLPRGGSFLGHYGAVINRMPIKICLIDCLNFGQRNTMKGQTSSTPSSPSEIVDMTFQRTKPGLYDLLGSRFRCQRTHGTQCRGTSWCHVTGVILFGFRNAPGAHRRTPVRRVRENQGPKIDTSHEQVAFGGHVTSSRAFVNRERTSLVRIASKAMTALF